MPCGVSLYGETSDTVNDRMAVKHRHSPAPAHARTAFPVPSFYPPYRIMTQIN